MALVLAGEGYAASADIHDGKGREAREWAAKVANYLNEKFPVTTVEVWQRVGGPSNRLYWVGKHPSLAAVEEFREKYEADEGYQQLLAEAEGFLIGVSVDEAFYRVIA